MNTVSRSFVMAVIFVFSINSVFAHVSEENVVYVDEQGFKPQKLSVEPGTTVTFKNIGEEDHWPASDSHPSHINYDGTTLEEHCTDEESNSFDACEAIPPNNSWAFSFTEVGTFHFHDHLWPHLTGQVMVTEDTNFKKGIFGQFIRVVKNTFEKISSLFKQEKLELYSGNTHNTYYEELLTRYREMLNVSDAAAVMEALIEESGRDAQVSAYCHDILHEIGQHAYSKYQGFTEAVKFQSDFCNSGYIHGVFESYFASSTNPVGEVMHACNTYAEKGKRPFDLWQCHHGAGHGFMYLTGGKLEESLSLCEQSFGTGGGASCKNGVYMELFNSELLANEPTYLIPTQPFSVCEKEEVAMNDCYLYVPTYLSQTLGVTYEDIFIMCNEIDSRYRSLCVQGIGSEAMKRNMHEPLLVFTVCTHAGWVFEEHCVKGAVSMYMNQKATLEAGRSLCEIIPTSYQKNCESVVASKESLFTIQES